MEQFIMNCVRQLCRGLPCCAILCPVWAQPVTGTTTITATVVASSCVGSILSGQQQSRAGSVDFGVIHPQTRRAPARSFSLLLSEYEGGETGCSAFLAYGRQQNVATLTFGDLSNAQLDARGVVTRYRDGAASPVRVRVRPKDTEATFAQAGGPGYITADFNQLQYPVDFAAKGRFDFSAILAGLEKAPSGEFTGALTVTVVYR